MEIKKVDDPYEVAKLIKFKDNAEECFPCERGEWIQWLVDAVKSPKLCLYIQYKEGFRIAGYAVAMDAVFPPLSDSVDLIYITGGDETVKSLLRHLARWAKSCRAAKIMCRTPVDAGFSELLRRSDFCKTGELWEHRIG